MYFMRGLLELEWLTDCHSSISNETEGDRKMEYITVQGGGVCRICGCTHGNPCHNPMHGFCWWEDESETVCSHCAESEIAGDPDTVHRVSDIPGWEEPTDARNDRLVREIREHFTRLDSMQSDLDRIRSLRAAFGM